jgi:hypothetical protein
MKILKNTPPLYYNYEEYALTLIENELNLHGKRSVHFLFEGFSDPVVKGFPLVTKDTLEQFLDWYNECGEGSMYLVCIGPPHTHPSFDLFLPPKSPS